MAEIVIANREDTGFVGVALLAQEVTGASRELHISYIKLLLSVEEVEFEEVGEVLAEGTDLRPEAKLSKLIFALNQHLILVSDKGGVPGSRA